MAWTGSGRAGPGHRRGAAVEHGAGIGVSPERGGVRVVGATGRIVRGAEAASGPATLVGLPRRLGLPPVRVGPEAGPLSRWPHAGLVAAGLEAVPPGARHAKAA